MNDILDLAMLRAALVARKAEIAAEIRHYPGPIPGCDAQFNRLLEIRQILAHELLRLDAVTDDSIGTAEFLARSPRARELPDILPLT
tara:strand:+ start:366 stop:626 length:261 start_codon:yes stop_codon:yes gene_type:complete